MNSENVWIPWNERTDLNIMYFKFEYVIHHGKRPKPKSYEQVEQIYENYIPAFYRGNDNTPKTLYSRFIFLDRIPQKFKKEFVAEFLKRFEKSLSFGAYSAFIVEQYCRIIEAENLTDDEIFLASKYRSSFNLEQDYLYKTVWETRSYLENSDREYYYMTNNLVPVADVPAAPAVSYSPAVPASVPADKDSPAENKTAKPKTAQKRGGRPTKEQEERICFAIIELFDSPRKNQIIGNIKTLGDAVKKINRLLRESGIIIDERHLDGSKKPGRLFRYLWYRHTGIFAWKYKEENLERDKAFIQEYLTKYAKYIE